MRCKSKATASVTKAVQVESLSSYSEVNVLCWAVNKCDGST